MLLDLISDHLLECGRILVLCILWVASRFNLLIFIIQHFYSLGLRPGSLPSACQHGTILPFVGILLQSDTPCNIVNPRMAFGSEGKDCSAKCERVNLLISFEYIFNCVGIVKRGSKVHVEIAKSTVLCRGNSCKMIFVVQQVLIDWTGYIRLYAESGSIW